MSASIMRWLRLLSLTLLTAPVVYSLSTAGTTIVDDSGKEVQLHGINIAGFNNFLAMAGNVNAGTDSISQDFATMLWRIKALGFNAVRVPFTFQVLNSASGYYGKDGCQVATFDQAVAATTPPERVQSYGKGSTPSARLLLGYPEVKGGKCSAGIPNDSVRARFLWVARQLGAAGLYMMPDFHLVKAFGKPDTTIYDADRFVAEWTALAKDLVAIPELQGKLAFDFVNEPDGFNLTWGTNSPDYGGVTMTELYLRLMDSAWPVCKNCLFVVEGTGQSGIRTNWGDGFNSNTSYLKAQAVEFNITSLTSAEPFLTALLDKPYVGQVVISPHFYCEHVTGDNVTFAGPLAYEKWSRSTGYFQTTGFCSPNSKSCRRFPVMNGEFGTGFETGNEGKCWNSIVQYMRNEAGSEAADGQHGAIRSWFYWVWNPESDDTSGGIVAKDYREITPLGWRKLQALTGEDKEFSPVGLGLTPWWLAA